MLGWESMTEYINALVNAGARSGLTFEQFLEREIDAFLWSENRKQMIQAKEYYHGEQDIRLKKRKGIGKDGKAQEIYNLPNNVIVDNRYAALVDQKTNYLFGQPMSVRSQNEAYSAALQALFTKKFLRTLKSVGMDAINQGVAWLYPYIDVDNTFKVQRFNPYEILPFWKDEDHTELDMVARIYDVQCYEGTQLKNITKVEVYHQRGIKRYVYSGKKLVADVECGDQVYLTKKNPKTGSEEPYVWDKLPIIAFKSNASETPLLNKVKSLQDALNAILSRFMDCMEEDPRNTILVLLNYEGEDLGEFRRNLATYGAIKITTVDGVQGDVRTLQIEVNAENFKVIIDLLRKAIVSSGKGFDAKEEKSGNSPNELNLKSMYSDIDLDANMTETEFQASFEELLWFYDVYCKITNRGSFEKDKVEVIFNRDIMISESTVIADIRNSVGILSKETLVAQHPYVDNVAEELQRIDQEAETAAKLADTYRGVFDE